MMALKLGKSARLRRLLEAGFLPEELPPPFVSSSFARYRQSLAAEWAANGAQIHKFISSAESFHVPKHGPSRRRVVIVNPINQFRVAKIIADHWIEIRKLLLKSKITEFRPIFDLSGPRAIFGVNWEGVNKARVRLSARYAHQFHTDISKFYGSIYTHSVAWAVFGKELVQANLNANWYTTSFAAHLDKAVRHGQRNQSIGVPIGPDTSRIISEIVAVGIEENIRQYIMDLDVRGLRYVDDITIGINEGESEELPIMAVERSLQRYELDVNFEKTKISGYKAPINVAWQLELKALTVGLDPFRQRNQIDRFFSVAAAYADTSEKDAVLKWAIKRSRSFPISSSNYTYFIELILSVARRAPACLPATVQLLIDAKYRRKELPLESIRKFCMDFIGFHVHFEHAFEVSWALFLCKGLGLKLTRAEVSPIFQMRSSVCALILMDMNSRGLITGGIDDTGWKSMCAHPDGLQSDMWLLAYEAVQKGWWSGPALPYVAASPCFGPMLAKDVFFYDEDKNVTSTRVEKKNIWQRLMASRLVFSRWEEYF